MSCTGSTGARLLDHWRIRARLNYPLRVPAGIHYRWLCHYYLLGGQILEWPAAQLPTSHLSVVKRSWTWNCPSDLLGFGRHFWMEQRNLQPTTDFTVFFLLCFKLMLWEHFQIWLDDSRYNYRSIAHYKCDTGYQMFGPDQRTCTADGTWSDRGPQCQSISTNCHRRHSIITISIYFCLCFRDLVLWAPSVRCYFSIDSYLRPVLLERWPLHSTKHMPMSIRNDRPYLSQTQVIQLFYWNHSLIGQSNVTFYAFFSDILFSSRG